MHALGQNWNNQIIKILSAQEGESSFEDKKWGGGRGVFSYYLIKGLEGLANRNTDSLITSGEMAAYLPFVVGEATNSEQNPTVSGNPKTNLFTFNKDLLALANLSDNENGLAVVSRGFSDELDPEIKKWYDLYRNYLQTGILIRGQNVLDTINCAKFYYLKLLNDPRAKTLLPSIKSSFIASLLHKTEVVLEKYIRGIFNDTDKLDIEYCEMAYAKSIVDTSYILYNYLNARTLFLKALRTTNLKKANNILRQVLKIEPDASYAYHRLGLNFENLDILDSVIFYYKKALTLSPTWLRAANNLGYYLKQEHRYKEAIYYLEQGLKIDSTATGLYYNLSSAYYSLYGNSKKGDSVINKGIQINKALYEKDSTQSAPIIRLASLLSKLGKHKSAIKYLNKAYTIDSKNIKCIEVLASENVKINNYREAIKFYKIAIEVDPRLPYDYEYLGDQYLNINQIDSAIEIYKKAIIVSPDINESYLALSSAFLLKKDFKSALKIINQAINKHPEKPENREALGEVYLQLGNYKLASKNFNNSIRMDPERSVIYYNIACDYSKHNDLQKSLFYLKLSFERGYLIYDNISVDPDLSNIRKLSQYRVLMKKYFPDKLKN